MVLGVVPGGSGDGLTWRLGDVPLLRRAVDVLVRSGVVDEIVVVAPDPLLDRVRALVAEPAGPAGGAAGAAAGVPVGVCRGTAGGPAAAVRDALRDREPEPGGVVVVHEPAYPLATAALVRAVVDALAATVDAAAIVPLGPVTDTLKRVGERGAVTSTVDRDRFRTVCSPQAFRADPLRAAVRLVADDDLQDQGADVLPRLVRAAGGRLHAVPAPGTLFRVGSADALVLAEVMLADDDTVDSSGDLVPGTG